MDSILYTSPKHLSNLVIWAHTHGTFCSLLPRLETVYHMGTALWICAAGHAYNWPSRTLNFSSQQEKEEAAEMRNRKVSQEGWTLSTAPQGELSQGSDRPQSRHCTVMEDTRNMFNVLCSDHQGLITPTARIGEAQCSHSSQSTSSVPPLLPHASQYHPNLSTVKQEIVERIEVEKTGFESKRLRDTDSKTGNKEMPSKDEAHIGQHATDWTMMEEGQLAANSSYENEPCLPGVAQQNTNDKNYGPRLQVSSPSMHTDSPKTNSPKSNTPCNVPSPRNPAQLPSRKRYHVSSLQNKCLPSEGKTAAQSNTLCTATPGTSSYSKSPATEGHSLDGTEQVEQLESDATSVTPCKSSEGGPTPTKKGQVKLLDGKKGRNSADIKVFREWLCSHHPLEGREVFNIPPGDLDPYLSSFYMDVRKINGLDFSSRTLLFIQTSIDRYMRENCYKHSVTHGHEFSKSQGTMFFKCQQLLQMERERAWGLVAGLTEQNVANLRKKGVLNRVHPEGLLNIMFLNNIRGFGIQRSLHAPLLRWGQIVLRQEEGGTEHLEWREETGGEDETAPRILGNPEDPANCPVMDYKEYARRRPQDMQHEGDPFYLVPQPLYYIWDETWYSRKCLSISKMDKIIKLLTH
ncbi:hypothetical protein FKM82_014937 [Ascaphus truei]